MGPFGVVLGDECVDRGLRGFQRLERFMIIEQFAAQGQVEPFDLPRSRRRRWLGQPVRVFSPRSIHLENLARLTPSRAQTGVCGTRCKILWSAMKRATRASSPPSPTRPRMS